MALLAFHELRRRLAVPARNGGRKGKVVGGFRNRGGIRDR